MLEFNLQDNVIIADNYDVQVQIRSVRTVSETDPAIVITPVVDTVIPVMLKVYTRPIAKQGQIKVEWRASNSSFSDSDLLPSWREDEPDGAYRYWQARVSILDRETLLERIEFKPVGVPESSVQGMTFR